MATRPAIEQRHSRWYGFPAVLEPAGATMDLPAFRYHPDPIASGSVVESEQRCDCCHARRGFIYQSSVYNPRPIGDPKPALCPWCIADGSAHNKFDARFNDTDNLTEDRVAPE